jgi:hypothetical protein
MGRSGCVGDLGKHGQFRDLHKEIGSMVSRCDPGFSMLASYMGPDQRPIGYSITPRTARRGYSKEDQPRVPNLRRSCATHMPICNVRAVSKTSRPTCAMRSPTRPQRSTCNKPFRRACGARLRAWICFWLRAIRILNRIEQELRKGGMKRKAKWLITNRVDGAPGMTRTCDLLVRSQPAFPNSLITEQIFLQENSN